MTTIESKQIKVNNMNNYEYWTEIKECTTDLVNEVIDNLVHFEKVPLDELTADLVEEYINYNGPINELVDSHPFIIYTYEALKVMEYTDNANYLTDNIGDIQNGLEWSTIVTQFAYWAMYGDIMDILTEVINKKVDEYLLDEYLLEKYYSENKE